MNSVDCEFYEDGALTSVKLFGHEIHMLTKPDEIMSLYGKPDLILDEDGNSIPLVEGCEIDTEDISRIIYTAGEGTQVMFEYESCTLMEVIVSNGMK